VGACEGVWVCVCAYQKFGPNFTTRQQREYIHLTFCLCFNPSVLLAITSVLGFDYQFRLKFSGEIYI